MMLFNASKSSQNALESYCLNTREELLFLSIREKIQLSTFATKERRLLVAQVEARRKEAFEKTASLRATLRGPHANPANGVGGKRISRKVAIEGKKIKKEQAFENPGALLEFKTAANTKGNARKSNAGTANVLNKAFDNNMNAVATNEASNSLVKSDDGGHIELVLKVMASMCDGQYKVLQDYLRAQPDNIKSVNLVAETTNYLSLLYSNLDASNANTVIQLFQTLNEFAAGNPKNHGDIFDNNIVDYVNHILRSEKYLAVCSDDQAREMQESISCLLMTMMEEECDKTADIIKEVCATLDLKSIKSVAVNSYEASQSCKDSEVRDEYLAVAFAYHFILEKVADLSPAFRIEDLYSDTRQQQVLAFFWKNSSSIEILKDGQLQRLRFRVKDKKVLRDEVKDQLKWSVDRTSSSTKIRELMEWSRDIIGDIYYQKKLRRNILADILIRFWSVWNDACIFLSLVINIVMIATWDAKVSLHGGEIVLHEDIDNPEPEVGDWFLGLNYALGAVHNVLSLFVLITYFLTHRPMFPSISRIKEKLRPSILSTEEYVPERKNQLRSEFFSVLTLYYVIFFLMSVAGTVWWGYFFAFHLLNIVYNNQMLQRVIKAITLNGKTLIWVGILGMTVLYIFTLGAFAFMRSTMNPKGDELPLYCGNLRQCLVTMIRYGFIGELFEFMKEHESRNDFQHFGMVTVFHVAFWILITTIGLNIVFGVILDTFSELRTTKYNAESDMKNKCYICNRSSYEFESYARGFEHHVKNEHNMWAYVFFLIHLKTTKVNDYTTLELEVHKELEDGKDSFFPIGRAVSLSHRDENVTEEKLEDIAAKVQMLIKRSEKEDLEKQYRLEKIKQEAWEKKYKEDQ